VVRQYCIAPIIPGLQANKADGDNGGNKSQKNTDINWLKHVGE
jgi:hypothetical protein